MSFKKVKEILVDVLQLDEDEVLEDSNLLDDLAAESIDFVDIAYSLEKGFNIKINPGDIFPAFLREVKVFNVDGSLTDEVKERFKKEYPHITDDQLEDFREAQDVNVFFSVKTITNFIETKTK